MKPIPATCIDSFRRIGKQYESMKVLLDGINATRAALEKGDYAANPQYGKWGTVWVPSTSMKPIVGPSWVNTTFGYLPRFAVGDSMSGVMQIPPEFSSPGAWVASLGVTWGSPTYAGEVIMWRLLVDTMAAPAGEFGGSVQADFSHTPGATNGKAHSSLRLPLRQMNLPPGTVMPFRVTRLTGAAVTNNPYLLGVSWAYQKQKFGLEEEP